MADRLVRQPARNLQCSDTQLWQIIARKLDNCEVKRTAHKNECKLQSWGGSCFANSQIQNSEVKRPSRSFGNSVQVPWGWSTDSQMDLSYIAQSISTLTNTVTKHHDELKADSQQVNRQAPSATAGSEVQLAEQTDQRLTAIVGSNTTKDHLDEGFTLLTAQTQGMSVSQSSTVTRTKFGYAMESLPFTETVYPKLRKAIVEGKDVNLAELLKPSSNAANLVEKEHSRGSHDNKYENDPRFHKNLTFQSLSMYSAFIKTSWVRHIKTIGKN